MLMTVSEVSKELRVKPQFVYDLIKYGLLKSIQIGNKKIRPETLQKFLEDYDGKDVNSILEGLKNEKTYEG